MSKVVCEHCAGSGRRAQGSYDDCDRCHGTGEFVSGSGEPVPAPTLLESAFKAVGDFIDSTSDVEEITPHARIHARSAIGYIKSELSRLGSARPPLPPQEISPEMVEAAFGADICDVHKNTFTGELALCRDCIRLSLEAALRVRGGALPRAHAGGDRAGYTRGVRRPD